MAEKKRRRYTLNRKLLHAKVINTECDMLSAYVETMADGLGHEVDRLAKQLESMTKGYDEESAQRTYDHFAEDIIYLTQDFPSILWQSVFLSLYIFFEEEMNGLCRRIRSIVEKKKGITKTKVPQVPGVVLPAQKCLMEFNVRLATKSAVWKRFEAYLGIRNLIVHNRGTLRQDPESDRVRKFISRHRHISLNKNGKFDARERIELTKDFCVAFHKDMRTLVVKTAKAIPKKLLEL